MSFGVSFETYLSCCEDVLMGRCHYVSLRRRHDIPIRRRKDVPLRHLGDVPLRRCRVFHLRRTCEVARTYKETSLRRRHVAGWVVSFDAVYLGVLLLQLVLLIS